MMAAMTMAATTVMAMATTAVTAMIRGGDNNGRTMAALATTMAAMTMATIGGDGDDNGSDGDVSDGNNLGL